MIIVILSCTNVMEEFLLLYSGLISKGIYFLDVLKKPSPLKINSWELPFYEN